MMLISMKVVHFYFFSLNICDILYSMSFDGER